MSFNDRLIRSNIFQELQSEGIDDVATLTGTLIVDLSAVNTKYVLRGLTIKSADPGVETVTVSKIKLINDIETTVDSFIIDTTNWGTYQELTDMFGDEAIFGDLIKIVCTTSAGTIAIIGQYSYAKAVD